MRLRRPKTAEDWAAVEEMLGECDLCDLGSADEVMQDVRAGSLVATMLEFSGQSGLMLWSRLRSGDVLVSQLYAPGIGAWRTIPLLESFLDAVGATRCKVYSKRPGWKRVARGDPRGTVTQLYELEIERGA